SARAEHAYVEAEILYTRTLQLFDRHDAIDDDLRRRVLQNRGDVRYRVARYDDSLKDFAKARSIAELVGDDGVLIELLLDEALALDWMQEFPSSKERVERARALELGQSLALEKTRVNAPLVRARLTMMSGLAQWRLGFREDAIRLC